MNSKIQVTLVALLGLVVLLESTMALPRGFKPHRVQGRRSTGPSPAPRQMPMGFRHPMSPSKRFASPPMTKPVAPRPTKRDQFPFSLSSILGLSSDSSFSNSLTLPYAGDSGTVPTSLDDAFKMGYSAGKSVATGDIFRNQFKPNCGQDDVYGYGGSPCSGTSYNFYLPQQTQPMTYLPDPGFTYVTDPGFTYITDPGVTYITDPLYTTPDDSGLITTIPVNEDDDYYPIDYVTLPQIYPDTLTYIPDNTNAGMLVDPPIVLQPDTLVDQNAASPVLVSADGSVTPVAIDSDGTVLVPVGTVDQLTVSDVLSNQ